MSNPELERLSKDIHSKPDLLMEVMDTNGDMDALIKYVNLKGYNVKEEDFGVLVKKAPNFTKLTKKELDMHPQNEKAFAVIVVVVAIFLWVV